MTTVFKIEKEHRDRVYQKRQKLDRFTFKKHITFHHLKRSMFLPDVCMGVSLSETVQMF
jgi:hypothetical protein